MYTDSRVCSSNRDTPIVSWPCISALVWAQGGAMLSPVCSPWLLRVMLRSGGSTLSASSCPVLATSTAPPAVRCLEPGVEANMLQPAHEYIGGGARQHLALSPHLLLLPYQLLLEPVVLHEAAVQGPGRHARQVGPQVGPHTPPPLAARWWPPWPPK